MIYTVHYRDAKSGARTTLELDVSSKAEVWPVLKERGIHAISVEEGTSSKKRKGRVNSPVDKKIVKQVLIALGVLGVGIGLAMFFLQNAPVPQVKEEPAKPREKTIATSAPAVVPVEQPVISTNAVAKKDRNAGAKTYIDEKGVKRYEGGARVFDPDAPRRPTVRVAQPGLFKNFAENQIYALLEIAPGETLFVTRKYDKRFLESFKKSLDEPIEFLDTDSEYDKEVKQAMIETKEDLKKRMEAGEDICKIMEDTYSEIQRLAEYKREVQKLVRENLKAEDLTDTDCEDLIRAANEMLASKGIAPVRNTMLLKRNLRLNSQSRKGSK